AAAALRTAYPRIDIVGAESGFRTNGARLSDRNIAERIHRSGANVLLVAFGSPKQELWIDGHRDAFPNVRVAIGVGSAFDYLAGIVVRAPRVFQRAGLEWLWRVAVQPWRLRRILTATVAFPLSVIRMKIRSDAS
ncbi:MAG: WecB/TagA/CpsF family glycosyltransferase, partial [Candidatus Kerfeldbacteria bacterium]|nr:WecB/TagA/CpsF family glycosyltransferase [Candidatus Kerfeldbacteria bacterium]